MRLCVHVYIRALSPLPFVAPITTTTLDPQRQVLPASRVRCSVGTPTGSTLRLEDFHLAAEGTQAVADIDPCTAPTTSATLEGLNQTEPTLNMQGTMCERRPAKQKPALQQPLLLTNPSDTVLGKGMGARVLECISAHDAKQTDVRIEAKLDFFRPSARAAAVLRSADHSRQRPCSGASPGDETQIALQSRGRDLAGFPEG